MFKRSFLFIFLGVSMFTNSLVAQDSIVIKKPNTEKIKTLRVFAHDARVELKKVIWSTKAEVIQTTVIVFVVVIIMSVLLWLLDKLLGAGIKFLLA